MRDAVPLHEVEVEVDLLVEAQWPGDLTPSEAEAGELAEDAVDVTAGDAAAGKRAKRGVSPVVGRAEPGEAVVDRVATHQGLIPVMTVNSSGCASATSARR